ncbi:glycosyltransferase family 4 protein [Hydnum rufescens UP504]|uniref:Alpha-1,3/1,6-mannosyltransferase ALG2 n=1 Tax=Hydnum rufescens UP504 TaxID=1448309 RepID=A0A9P6ASM0_9AGAM|nr:glycosyltransferase family 4 protein [Hydnum rufescens UP504]
MGALRIGILHPDLGIGGAERLVVDAALGLQKLGHHVEIYTSYHDPDHCFDETRDGTLNVNYARSPFPRALYGRFHIAFAILRQIHLVVTLLLGARSGKTPPCDVYMVDQLSACIPLLRWGFGRRVVFYCHFPDKLLSDGKTARTDGVKRGSLLKRIYRWPADWLEETTTGKADVILANSHFTASVFMTAFPSIKVVPRVVHPGINISAYTKPETPPTNLGGLEEVLDRSTFLSLNRFERKKDLELAIEAFAQFHISLSEEQKANFIHPVRLVLAGGYDPRVLDNVRTLEHLRQVCVKFNLSTYTLSSSVEPHQPHASDTATSHGRADVSFLLNFTTSQRTALLHNTHTLALLYTPSNEHFGIVPVEAMIAGLPVVACESGGPVESVLPFPDGESLTDTRGKGTGFLVPPSPASFASAMHKVVNFTPAQRAAVASTAQERARTLFGMDAMCEGLSEVLEDAIKMGPVGAESRAKRLSLWGPGIIVLAGILFILSKYI